MFAPALEMIQKLTRTIDYRLYFLPDAMPYFFYKKNGRAKSFKNLADYESRGKFALQNRKSRGNKFPQYFFLIFEKIYLEILSYWVYSVLSNIFHNNSKTPNFFLFSP